MLGAFDIRYLPRTVVSGHVLANLVAKFTKGMEKDGTEEGGMPDKEILVITTSHSLLWELYVNKAANQKGSAIEIVLVSPECITIEKSLKLSFPAMNNEAEYEALWAGLNAVKKLGGKAVEVFCDLRLIVGLVIEEFEAKDQRMQWYLSQVKQLQSNFEAFSIEQIPRSRNFHANSLATLATLLGEGLSRIIMVEDLVASSWDSQVLVGVNVVHVGPSWMDLVVSFLRDGTLLEDRTEAKKVRRKAPWY